MLGSTFNRVVRSLSFFANNFSALTYYSAVLQRLQEFERECSFPAFGSEGGGSRDGDVPPKVNLL